MYGVLEGLTIMLLLRRYQHLAIGGPLCIKKENISKHGDVIFVVRFIDFHFLLAGQAIVQCFCCLSWMLALHMF